MLIVIGRNRAADLILIILLIIIEFSNRNVHSCKSSDFHCIRQACPVYSVLTQEPKVVLHLRVQQGDLTREILKVLEDYGVMATFFLSGEWMERNKDSARLVDASGHELGNYTYSAPYPNSLLKADLKRELEKAHKYIEKATGKAPKVFRPPYGEYSNKVIEAAKELNETVI